MSLKAKLEAVIYAAEEPVTLTQLAALFSTDALEWKAEREAAAAAAGQGQAESLPLLNAEFDYEQLEQPSEPAAPEASGPDTLGSETASPDTPSPDTASPDTASPDAASSEPAEALFAAPEAGDAPAEAAAPEAAVDPEIESKRLARVRDREVRGILRTLLEELIATYASDDRGIEIKEIAGGYRMATKPECHDAARMFVKSLKPALKLSLPALETLAVIAYKQPVTAPEVNEIRGVDSSGVFGSLLARKLIATAGRKQVIGRPILYKTTKEFLLKFGLNEVSELPSMEEFEKIAQLEFEDMAPVSEDEALDRENTPVENGLNQGEYEDGDEAADEAGINAPLEGSGAEKESKEEDQKEAANQTAEAADSNSASQAEEPETSEPTAETPATQAETPSAEATPAAPSPMEQAETETVPHD